MRVWLRAAAAATLAFAAPLAHSSALERFEAFLHDTRSARAEFEQRVYDRDQTLVQKSSGSFEFRRPGLFRWTYAAPTPQLIVGDGKDVWIYDRDLEQVTVRRMAKALGSTPAALLAGSAEVERAFDFSEAGARDGLEWLDAKPKDADAGFDLIGLGLGPEGVESMELRDHFGQTTRLRFHDITLNPALDPAAFRFTPPKGVDVLGEP
ncbi:MAG TPA: outer membrane lipoprotein chaperone LolA [Burkholderiales bacterium]|nr:outer membrane lipoprotein chaperone LolA [Burkholderiales bacterium]